MRKAWVLHYAPNKPRIHSFHHNCKLLCKEHWLTHLVNWCLTKRRCESKININVKRERLIHEDKRGAERGERAVHSHDKVRTREGKISTKGKFQNHQPGNLLLDVFGSPTKPGTWKGKVPPFLLLPWTFGREHLNNYFFPLLFSSFFLHIAELCSYSLIPCAPILLSKAPRLPKIFLKWNSYQILSFHPPLRKAGSSPEPPPAPLSHPQHLFSIYYVCHTVLNTREILLFFK